MTQLIETEIGKFTTLLKDFITRKADSTTQQLNNTTSLHHLLFKCKMNNKNKSESYLNTSGMTLPEKVIV
jgi:hypothetical protein